MLKFEEFNFLKKYNKYKKIFTSNNIKILRKNMPQVRSAYFNKFLSWIDKENIKKRKYKISARKLKATQKDLVPEFVKSVIEKGNKDKRPVLVTKDFYVLDGHHRVLAYQIQNKNILILQIDITIKDALEKLKEFPDIQYYNK